MSKLTLLILLLLPASLFSQVIISPYIVYLDQQKRFGSFIVQNESNEEYELTISFVFGYPVSDSVGTTSMKYIEEPGDTLPSITNWIRAFPKSFILKPRQRQVIRMTVRPPDSIAAGTYWTRVVTSSTPKSESVNEISTGISARINFVINQVTTVLYRIDTAATGIKVNDFISKEDSNSIEFFADLTRINNSPFFGDFSISISDSSGSLVDEQSEYISVYFDLVKRLSFNKSDLSPGKYSAELKITLNEKVDVPESKLEMIPPIIKTINFEVID